MAALRLRMIRRSGLYVNGSAGQRRKVCEQLSAEEGSAASKQAASGIKSLVPQRFPLCNADVVTRLVYRPLPGGAWPAMVAETAGVPIIPNLEPLHCGLPDRDGSNRAWVIVCSLP